MQHTVMPATLELVDGDETITIRSGQPTRNVANTVVYDPILCTKWDLGAPDVRENTVAAQSADGMIDTSVYTGARTVSLELSIVGEHPQYGDTRKTAYYYADRLAAMTHPSRRPVLRITRISPETGVDSHGNPETWELQLRGTPFSVSYDRAAAGRLQMQLTFTAPLGYLEGPWRGRDSTPVLDNDGPDGLTFPIAFPATFGFTFERVPTKHFLLLGSAPISPVIYMYGPCKNPYVTTDDGERFGFTGLTLQAGQMVQVDMEAGTALLDGAPTASVYQLVDFNNSTFWRWAPGREHVVRYHANGGFFAVQYRERRLTI